MFDDRIGNLQKMLARMGPEGRQRYAADHADDPIAVSMALFVNNIAKEIKEGKRGEPEIQTPVVQQAIQAMNQPRMPQGMPPQGMPPQGQPQTQQQAPQQAPQGMPPQGMPPPQGQTQMAADGGYMDSRLPEDMGIGALPERSLSNMADGGIVGYAERGLVEPAKTPVGRMFQGLGQNIDETSEALKLRNEIYQKYVKPSGPRGLFTEQSDVERENAKAIMGRLNSLSPTEMRFVLENGALPQGSSSFQPYDRNRKGNVPSDAAALPATPPVVGGGAEDPNGAGAPRLAARPAVAPSAVRPAAVAGANDAASASSTTSGLGSLAAQYGSINTGGMSSAEDINALRKKIEGGIKAIDPVAEERKAYNARAKEMSEQTLSDLEKDIKERGDPYTKREERANKQEASIAESAERNPYLSLMEAGFAMMAGDSPYAMKNIGVGALVGTKAYKEGLDKIEIAKTKLTETRDKIEDYRINREDLNTKERRAAKTDIRNTELSGLKNIMEGLTLASGRKDTQVAADMKAAQDAFSDQIKTNAQIKIAQIGKEADFLINAQNNAAALERTKYSSNKAHALPNISTIANQLRAADPSLSVKQSLNDAALLMSTSATTRADSNELIQNRKNANEQIQKEGMLKSYQIESEKDPVKKQTLIDNWNNRKKEIKKDFGIIDSTEWNMAPYP
jgi:hypothetical protein